MDNARIITEHLVTSGRTNFRQCARGEAAGQLVRVFRTTFVDVAFLQGCDRWTFRRCLALVRICAVASELGSAAVVVGRSAATLHGVESFGVPDSDDVEVAVRSHRGGTIRELPAVAVPGQPAAAAGRVVFHHSRFPEDFVTHMGAVAVVDLPTAAVQCARSLDPLEAVVIVSGALRSLAEFDRFRLDRSRAREEQWRARLESLLTDQLHGPGVVRAREVIRCSDAGCESVAERILLWILKSRGIIRVITQAVHRVRGWTYYVDFEIEGTRVVIEFDGKEKYGRTPTEILRSLTERDARQRDLESLGLVVIRFEYRELWDPDAVVDEVLRRLPSRMKHRARPMLASALMPTWR